MERQFNRHHGSTNRTFSLDQLVLAKDYRDGVEKWTADRIRRRIGRVTYDVEVQSPVWVRHAYQLRFFFSTGDRPVQPSHSTGYSPGDMFELRQDVSAAAPNPEVHPPSICTPRIWTDRSRRQVVHMQVNLRQLFYEQ
ncbi:hypothetical protein EG68_11980 [Paragonimus skrjabini miyazakii]|uniref:Uncharacterized protein n=1 Tax=Paragonimus skrjabini miyazakii TaxID=59628 RepID=A0A8S9YDA7_9TREM|nr:hypothetical protein EG68_11980 [Paragonimus skrjabini miyazakii]